MDQTALDKLKQALIERAEDNRIACPAALELARQQGVDSRSMARLLDELEIKIKKRYLIINRLPGDKMPPALQEAVAQVKAYFLGIVPYDVTLTEFEFTGRPLIELDVNSPVYQAVREMFKRALAHHVTA